MTDPSEKHPTPETGETAVLRSNQNEPTSFASLDKGKTADNLESPADLSSPGNASTTPESSPAQIASEVSELYLDIKTVIAERTWLPDSICWFVTFWIVSTWFLEAFSVYPCLVLTGPAFDGTTLLKVLNDLCRNPSLLAGWRRSDLQVLAGYRTSLISIPVLTNDIACLLGNLTIREYLLVEQGGLHPFAGARAVHFVEDRSTVPIQNSIYIDVTMPLTAPIASPVQRAPETLDDLRNRLNEYRNRNLGNVQSLGFRPTGLSRQLSVIAHVLGSCITNVPSLQQELVTLLQPPNQRAIDDRNDSWDALVLAAALKLSQNNDEIYVKQILAEIDPQLDTLGEKKIGRSERVGRRLSNLGLRTRKLSDQGKGLRLDPATRIHLHELGAVYLVEDSI